MFTAVLSYVAAVICVIAIGYGVGDLGGDHPVIASLGASVVFFVGAGIGLANLPDLRIRGENDHPPG